MALKKKSILLSMAFLIGCFVCACGKEDSIVDESLVKDTEDVSSTEEMLHMVNHYMDEYLQTDSLVAKAKAEKYAKIISKTVMNSGGFDSANAGQNAFFYDSAILTSLSAALTSASLKRPLPRRFLNTFCSLSDKLSNAIGNLLCRTDHGTCRNQSSMMSLEICSIWSIRLSSFVSLKILVFLWISSTMRRVVWNLLIKCSLSSYALKVLSQRLMRS